MNAFKGKELPIDTLIVNGMTSITSMGLNELLLSCFHTLRILEAAFMN